MHPKGAYFTRGSGHNQYGALHRGFRRVPGRARPAACASSTPPRQLVPPPVIERPRHSDIGVVSRSAAATARCTRPSTCSPARGIARELHARAGLPVRRGGRGVPRSARADLRRRAEPRRAVALAADAGNATWTEIEAALGPALQRPADPRPTRSCWPCWPSSATRSDLRRRPAPEGSPHDLHHQTESRPSRRCRRNELGLTRRDYEGAHVHALRRLRARLDHRRRSSRRCWGCRSQPQQLVKLSGIGCSSKTTAYFVSGVARLQLACTAACPRSRPARTRPTGPALHRRVGRRRHPVDRPRPVRARHPAQREHAVHHREQRRVRPHQGPVLGLRRHRHEGEEGRGQPAAADRPGAARADARRHLRRAQLLRRQGSSSCR